ncbi:MAG: signal peptide peptidase SppA [Cyanobacteria bacterium P01_D01_bin.1]
MRDFFKVAAASAVGTLVGLFSLILLLGIGAFGLVSVLLVSSGSEPEAEIEDQSVLMFDLATDIIDGAVSNSGGLLDESFYGVEPSISLYDALQAIEAAADDDRISGIYLTGVPAEGLATLKEMRQALSEFKESGKPILAYSNSLQERDYYMMSVADDLLLAPVGLLEINGFRSETQFLGNALKKYGVGVQVIRAGRYKSAVEPFTRSESSPEEKQQTEILLSGLWQDFLETVTSDRKVTPTQMQTFADQVGLIEPEQALESGLVDRLGFYPEMLAELETLSGQSEEQSEADASEESWEDANEPEFPNVALSDYARSVAMDRGFDSADEAIAVVYAEGNIIVGEGVVPGSITSEGLAATLRDMRKDDDIKAVVLRVNSPGGSATASEIIANEVGLLAAEKPLIVSMGDYAASGGYMIAAPGAKIVASSTTITGSIGVYGLLLNFQEIANKNGITWDGVKTAQLAGMETVSRPKSEPELRVQQEYVDTLYDRFTNIVADGRDISLARVGQVAQGRVWTGAEAIRANLVDEIGGLGDAIALAAETAEIEEFKVEEYPRLPSFEEQLFDSIFGADMVTRLPWNRDALTDQLLKLREEFTLLESLNDPNSMYMRLPFTTEIE